MSDLFPYDKSPIPVPDLSDQIERTTELIGRGGYGTVYKGRWLGAATNTTPATIAIKIIDLVPLIDDAKRNRRFKQITRELSLWCSIQHENILPLLGIARINGDINVPAFVCPWMENGNAKEFCSRNPRFPPLLILYDIINGLHYLHTSKPEIVHGDIKAVNVLINNRCEACLCDFGLSRFLTDNTLWKTTATAAGGTARWMAPELLNGDESTPTKKSDIYAYAMTCYEIISGDVPFQSVSNDMAILFKVTKGQRPDRIESFHSNFMWDIITHCWEQEPKARLATEKVLGLLQPKVDWKGVEEEQAKIGEKYVALEKEMALLKGQMAKGEEDMKALKEEKEKAWAKAEEVLKQKDLAWGNEIAVLRKQMTEALEEDMKTLREEKEEDLKEKDMPWAKIKNEITIIKEQMAEAQEDTKEQEEGLEKTEEDLKALREEKKEALARAKAEEDMKILRKDDRSKSESARKLGRHFYRLNRNWKQEKPSVVGRVRTLTIDKNLDSIAQIARTPYVITHSILKCRLSVWSTENGKRLCSIDADRRVDDLSTGWPEHGKFTVTLLTQNELVLENSNSHGGLFIRVLTVDYNGPEVKMDITFEIQLESSETRHYRAIFLNADVVGVLYMIEDEEDHQFPFHVLAFNRKTGQSTDIRVSLSPYDHTFSWSGQVGTSFWNDNLYILYEYNHGGPYHSWIPKNMLPYNENTDLPFEVAYNAQPLCREEGQGRPRDSNEGILTMKADFGIIASTVYTFNRDNNKPEVGIDFWVIDTNSLAEAEKSGTLPIPNVYPRVTIPGTIRTKNPSTWSLYQSTNSGLYFVVALDDWERKPKIVVVHFQLPDHRFTVHEIEVPPYVKVHRVSDLFIDERLGTISLYISKGKMFVMNYA